MKRLLSFLILVTVFGNCAFAEQIDGAEDSITPIPKELLKKKYHVDEIQLDYEYDKRTGLINYGGKVGLFDQQGVLVFNPNYVEISKPVPNFYLAKKDNGHFDVAYFNGRKYMFLNNIEGLDFASLDLKTCSLPVKKNGRWGLVSFDYGQIGVILPYEFDFVGKILRYKDEHDLIILRQNGEFGLLDLKTGKMLQDYSVDSIETLDELPFLKFRNGNKYALYTVKTKKLSGYVFDNIFVDKSGRQPKVKCFLLLIF